MALLDLGGFIIDTSILVIFVAIMGGMAGLVVFMALRKKPATPIKVETLIRIPVSEANIPQIGELLSVAGRTEDELYFEHPDWRDSEGNKLTINIDIRKKQPLRFIDLDKNMNESWLILDRGELQAVSVTDLVETTPERSDTLAANPRDVGNFLAHQSSVRGGLGQLLTWQNLPFLVAVGLAALFGGIMIGYFGLPPRILH